MEMPKGKQIMDEDKPVEKYTWGTPCLDSNNRFAITYKIVSTQSYCIVFYKMVSRPYQRELSYSEISITWCSITSITHTNYNLFFTLDLKHLQHTRELPARNNEINSSIKNTSSDRLMSSSTEHVKVLGKNLI